MNIINSRILKSSRPAINRSIETITAYSCQMYIQSFKISHRGYVYFVWSCNNSHISSLRYQANGKLIQVKETLTISVRVVSKNEKELVLNSNLKLMAETGEELDQFQMPVNTLTSQYKQIEIPMDRGLVNIKVRRKLMNIKEEEDISYQRIYRSKISRIQEKSVANIATVEYQSLQEEHARTKKDLQDAVYLNNKLKNDRDVLLATKQQLQLQIETIIIQITKEISMLRQYYNNKMSIRQHCYEQEIEDLVNLFNSNAEQSKKTVEMILKQKIKLEEELKPINQRIKKYQQEISKKDQLNLTLQNEKKELQISLGYAHRQIQEKKNQISLSTQSHGNLQLHIKQKDLEIQNLSYEIQQLKKTGEKQEEQMHELQQNLYQIQLQSKGKDNKIFQLQEKIIHFQSKQTSFSSQKEQLKRQIHYLQDEKGSLANQINDLNGKLQQFEYEMQFNQNVMSQLKRQHAQKQQQLYSQLQSLQAVYSQKMQDIIAKFEKQKEQLISNNKALEEKHRQYEQTIRQLQNNVKGSEIQLQQLGKQINLLENQLKNNQHSQQQKNQAIRRMQAELQRLKTQENLIQTGNKLQKKPSQPKLHRQQSFGKRSQQQVNQELAGKINELQQEIKRLKNQNQKSLQQINNLKTLNLKLQSERQKQKSPRSSKPTKKQFEQDMQKSINIRSFNQEQVREIVNKKERQIKQLRKRVDYLEALYNGLQIKFNQISKKYPQVDLAHFQLNVPKIQEWCQSQQEEERIINQNLTHNSKTLIKDNSAQSLHNHKRHHQSSTPTNILSNSLIKKLNKAKRADSIAQAIIEKDEEVVSNPSANHRRSFQPHSQNKIRDDYYPTNLQKRESLGIGRVTIQVPQSELKMKKQNSFGSYDHSQRSGTSYIKVSHSKRIKDLEDQIRSLLDKQKRYQARIQECILNINALTAQNTQLKKNQQEKEIIKPIKIPEKVNKQSQVIIQDERLKNLMHESQLKQLQVQKMYLRVGDLEDTLKRQKGQSFSKIKESEAKLSQNEKRLVEIHKKYQALDDTNKQLHKMIEQLQQKLKKQKQSAQQTRLSLKQHQMQLTNIQNELKKCKSLNQTLEQKIQKLSGGQLMVRQLTRQLQDFNKKSLDQTRTINHLKLQKDALEEQLRLIKKRQNDYLRVSTEWQEKAAALDRAIEQQKRKEAKLRRQIEQGQQQNRRSKQNIKKAEQEIQALNSSQSTWQSQRRKHLDQISALQDQLSRKDYQLGKLNKQIEKWKIRAEEKDEMRLGKKSQLREEIDRLQSELIRRQKKILQQSQQNKFLRNRLELYEQQNKRVTQQKNQTYGQKLKYYVDQMSNIKKLLEQYQNENSRLKIDNTQFYEQLQMLQINYDKLQMKYDQNIEREESILTDLQAYINQVNALKDRLASAHAQLDESQSAFFNLRKEFDNEKLQSKKIGQKLQVSERNLQRALAEIRQTKIKISQWQTNNEVNSKISERYKALQRKKNELQEQYRRIKSEYDNVINLFIYKREDLEKAVTEARNHEKRLKNQEIQRVNQQCSKTIQLKTQRLQQEILDAYNQNTRLRNQLQSLQQQNGHLKGKLSQLQNISARFSSLQNQSETNKIVIDQLKEQIRKKNDKISKVELSIQSIQAECNTKERQLTAFRTRTHQLQKTIQKLSHDLQAAKNSYRQLQQTLLQSNHAKNRQKSQQQFHLKQRQFELIQQYQSKIRNYELQMQKLKEKQAKNAQEYVTKMKKLEQKMDEMQQALRQKEKAIQGNYEAVVHQLQSELMKLSQELQQKMQRIDDLNQAIIILQGQNRDLAKQLQQSKYQNEQERHIFESQISRLKSKLKEQAQAYEHNIKSLEQQLIMKRQQGNNTSNSRLKANDQQRISKRYEQKIKNKDKKIEELKESIYNLQQTILKLKKKQQTYEITLSELQKLKITIIQIQKERKSTENKYDQELNKDAQTIRDLRRQILLLRESEERLKLVTQQKTFENQSIGCELKTIRQLYQQLQRELQKRKNNLTAQLEEQSNLQLELRTYESKIAEYEQKLMEELKRNRQMQIELKKKGIQIRKYIEIIAEHTKKEQNYLHQNTRLGNQLTAAKKQLQELNNSSQMNKNEAGKTKMQMIRLRKSQQQLRLVCKQKQQAVSELKRLYDELSSRYRECQQNSSRYTIINERTREQLGLGIEQAIERYIVDLHEREGEYNELVEEIEELKFINERKYLDYDELKRENFELNMKVQDLEVLNDQLQTLRKICDRLEEEKKNSVFRQEVLRLQLQNLGNTVPELKNRIDSILSAPTMPSYTNFSFY